MFSFKKKDKDKTIETKEERRERRKKEKEKDKHKSADRKAHGELGNIVAGSAADGEDPKKGRFSFRKADKRRYEVEHDYDNRNTSPGVEHSDFAARTGRSGSTDTTGSTTSGSAPDLFGSAASVSSNTASSDTAPQAGYRPADEQKRYQNEVSEDGKPVPKPRIKRKKSSSIEIKLQSPKQTTAYDSYENKTGDIDEEKQRVRIGEVNGTSSINVRPSDEAISASPLSDKHGTPESAPPKPPRILADRAGVVEFEVKLINVGSKNDQNKANTKRSKDVDGPITATSTVQSFADAPGVDFRDFGEPKIVLPPRDASPASILSPSEKTLEEMGVDLKLPEVQPAISGVARVIKLKRRSSGDFGFALRRANAPGSGQTVHFVEPVGANGTAGLLPGDRLVEVNGVNVENEPREKIIEMIVMSGDEVVIKVIPVPELSELSVRSGLDGSTVQLDESNLKAGTLARSGSKRIKKKVSAFARC